MLSINLVTVFAAAITGFVLGFLFHGPVSGKLWMKLADIHPTGNEKFKDMIPQMVWNFVAQLVTSYVLAVIYFYVSTSQYSSGPGITTGIITALWLWLGFLIPSSSIDVIWMGKKKSLWIFEAACSLVVMIVMGAMIGGWQ